MATMIGRCWELADLKESMRGFLFVNETRFQGNKHGVAKIQTGMFSIAK